MELIAEYENRFTQIWTIDFDKSAKSMQRRKDSLFIKDA